MVGLRLFLPEVWNSDTAKLDRAGVPESRRVYRSKPKIALAEIDRLRAAGARVGCVLADAGYRSSGRFRHGLSERGLTWAVGIPYKQKVYSADVAMVFPVVWRSPPGSTMCLMRNQQVRSNAADSKLAQGPLAAWQQRPSLSLLCCCSRPRRRWPATAHSRQGGSDLSGEEVWVVGEHRSFGERKYYLSNQQADTPLKQLAGAIKACWVCEQAHQHLKEALGLDYFEGRSWSGLHRHALLCMIALAFLQCRRPKAAKGGKRIAGLPLQPSLPAIRQAIISALTRPPPSTCPHCHKPIPSDDLPKLC